MKKLILISVSLFIIVALQAQDNKAELLQYLEKDQQANEDTITATLKMACRLFGARDDLTSVIMIIPSGSVVKVIDSDSTYLDVVFEDAEGYILKRQAIINKSPENLVPANQTVNAVQENQPEPENNADRFSYLESKYGTSMAARLYAGKIWKGMPADMVRDSWGQPLRINNLMRNGTVRSEWIYKNTWLYIENNSLVDWGPVRK